MRTSFVNIIFVLLSMALLGWGVLLVTGYTEYDVIPGPLQVLNLPSLAIVLGGIMASVFISYPSSKVFTALRESTRLFSHTTINDSVLEQDIQKVLDWQKRINQNKTMAVSELADEYEGYFEGYLFSVLDTNYTLEELRELGEINIEENYSRQIQINQIILNMGKTAPVFGMLGTLFGLIVILSGFTEVESLLGGLGAALMTTLYGIVVGNFVFTPMAKKLNNIAATQYFRENLILEGLLLVIERKSSLQVYDRLQAHMKRNGYQL